jgi:hypothetical protein
MAQSSAEATRAKTAAVEIVLVDQTNVMPATVRQWKAEGFQGVAVILDDKATESACHITAEAITGGQLSLYWWIEVGRNPKLADAHPRWMASLGMHHDWQKNFPTLAEPKEGLLAKAYPWVPIGYQEAFDAHLGRIEQLLKRVPPGWQGVLLNDLQAGPSSCGCGNLQCRWAIDYGVKSTATKLSGDFTAAKFLAELRKRIGEKTVIPVWTTECEEVDLPAEKNHGQSGTQLCGTVGCATGLCPERFSRQWSALAEIHSDPIALLALHRTFLRTHSQFGGGPTWVTNAFAYLQRTLPANKGKLVAPRQLWAVIEGATGEEAIARKAAAQTGVSGIIVARTKIEQSYEPRLVPVK